MSHPRPESTICSQSKGIGSADISASMGSKIRTIPTLLAYFSGSGNVPPKTLYFASKASSLSRRASDSR
jgi:hypothetical protein